MHWKSPCIFEIPSRVNSVNRQSLGSRKRLPLNVSDPTILFSCLHCRVSVFPLKFIWDKSSSSMSRLLKVISPSTSFKEDILNLLTLFASTLVSPQEIRPGSSTMEISLQFFIVSPPTECNSVIARLPMEDISENEAVPATLSNAGR